MFSLRGSFLLYWTSVLHFFCQFSPGYSWNNDELYFSVKYFKQFPLCTGLAECQLEGVLQWESFLFLSASFWTCHCPNTAAFWCKYLLFKMIVWNCQSATVWSKNKHELWVLFLSSLWMADMSSSSQLWMLICVWEIGFKIKYFLIC